MAKYKAAVALLALFATLAIGRAAIPFPIGPGSLLTQPEITNAIGPITSLAAGLKSLISDPSPNLRAALLGVNITGNWTTDPYAIRLLADAVQSYIILYSPAVIGSALRSWPLAPLISHSLTLATPAGRTTAPNSDTVYSISRIELAQGPFEVRVPAIGDNRFYSFVLYDTYQNVIASLGSSQGLTQGFSFLVVGPSTPLGLVNTYKQQQAAWGAQAQPGALYSEVVESPTDGVLLLIRILSKTQNATDLPNIRSIQAGISVQPYKFQFNPTPYAVNNGRGLAAATDPNADPAWWYNWATQLVAAYPPPASYLSQNGANVLNRFGLLDPLFNFSHLTTEQQAALSVAIPIANRLLDAALLSDFEYDFPTGWHLTSRSWGWYGSDWVTNAYVAKAFYLANSGVDSVYPAAFTDSAGQPLTGANGNTYTWTITPSALPIYTNRTGWWSFIAYDSNTTLIENPIQRYTIGDRTDGLSYNADGSLTITLSYTQPTDPVASANWLPVGNGPFFLVLRLYNPFPEVLDGKYVLPAVFRTNT